MPFVKRKIEPRHIRRHGNWDGTLVFEEHTEVANHALTNVLKQLSSLTWNAESIFREIEEEFSSVAKRCRNVHTRLEVLNEVVESLDPKEVPIPVSDLDTESKLPVYLHYRSGDSTEEDLFTPDSRTPCLIHLHQKARNDWNGVFRGSQAYSKSTRPKSFDPMLLLDDDDDVIDHPNYLASKSTTNIVGSPELRELYSPRGVLPTPVEKMQQECSQKIGQVVTVDTSGQQFDRVVNLRRSQRAGSGVLRRKNQQKFRDRHKTLTALPDSVHHELGLESPVDKRGGSLHSDVISNTSFVLAESSVGSESPPQLSARIRPPAASNFKQQAHNRLSMPAADMKFLRSSLRRTNNNKNVASDPSDDDSPISPTTSSGGGARVSLQDDMVMTSRSEETSPTREGALERNVMTSSSSNNRSILRHKDESINDRLSSGFWSGTESQRHSTTSEILQHHHNVSQALNKVLAAHSLPPPNGGVDPQQQQATSLTASTASLNSRLSTLDHDVNDDNDDVTTVSDTSSSSVFEPQPMPLTPASSRPPVATPAGAYRFMNDSHVTGDDDSALRRKIRREGSPLDASVLILGARRGEDGLIRAAHGETPKPRFNFGNELIANDPRLRHKQLLRQQKKAGGDAPPLNLDPPTRREGGVVTADGVFVARRHPNAMTSPAGTLTKPNPPPTAPKRTTSLRREAKEIMAFMDPITIAVDQVGASPPRTPPSASLSPQSDYSPVSSLSDSATPTNGHAFAHFPPPDVVVSTVQSTPKAVEVDVKPQEAAAGSVIPPTEDVPSKSQNTPATPRVDAQVKPRLTMMDQLRSEFTEDHNPSLEASTESAPVSQDLPLEVETSTLDVAKEPKSPLAQDSPLANTSAPQSPLKSPAEKSPLEVIAEPISPPPDVAIVARRKSSADSKLPLKLPTEPKSPLEAALGTNMSLKIVSESPPQLSPTNQQPTDYVVASPTAKSTPCGAGELKSPRKPPVAPKPPRVAPKPFRAALKPSHAAPKPSQAAPKPSEAAPKPAEQVLKSSQAQPKPSQEETPKPSQEAPQPPQEAPKPSKEAPKPSQEAPKPSQETPKPSQKAPKPTQEVSKPSQEAPKPTPEAPKPSKEVAKPSQETQKPSKEAPKPTPAVLKPSQEEPKPSRLNQQLRPSVKQKPKPLVLASDTQRPGLKSADHVTKKTANARAAFFGLSGREVAPSRRSWHESQLHRPLVVNMNHNNNNSADDLTQVAPPVDGSVVKSAPKPDDEPSSPFKSPEREPALVSPSSERIEPIREPSPDLSPASEPTQVGKPSTDAPQEPLPTLSLASTPSAEPQKKQPAETPAMVNGHTTKHDDDVIPAQDSGSSEKESAQKPFSLLKPVVKPVKLTKPKAKPYEIPKPFQTKPPAKFQPDHTTITTLSKPTTPTHRPVTTPSKTIPSNKDESTKTSKNEPPTATKPSPSEPAAVTTPKTPQTPSPTTPNQPTPNGALSIRIPSPTSDNQTPPMTPSKPTCLDTISPNTKPTPVIENGRKPAQTPPRPDLVISTDKLETESEESNSDSGLGNGSCDHLRRSSSGSDPDEQRPPPRLDDVIDDVTDRTPRRAGDTSTFKNGDPYNSTPRLRSSWHARSPTNRSPSSTLEKQRHQAFRFSTGSLERSRRMKSGVTNGNSQAAKRDDFKALLLQSSSRSSGGSQMSAAEKLKLTSPRVNTLSNGKPQDHVTSPRIVSSNDLRSVMGRGQRSNRSSPAHGSPVSSTFKKQHPPVSLSRRFNTPQRHVMMSISEANDECDRSPDTQPTVTAPPGHVTPAAGESAV